MTIEHLSHSTVNDFKECGEKVRLRKVEKVPSAPSWSLVGGSLVHTVTEALDIAGLRHSEARSKADAFTKETFDAVHRSRGGVSGFSRDQWRASGRASKDWPDKENYDWWLENGPGMVRNWRRFIQGPHYQIAIMNDVPAIEIGFDVEIGGVKVVGYIDRVLEHVQTKELVVVDLKSGTRDPMSTDQLGLYRVGLDKAFDGKYTPKWGTYFMVRKGATTLHFDLTKYSDGRLEYEYAAAWAAMQAGLFLPKIGPLCSSCGVRDYCRAVDGPKADDHLPYKKG
jgi:hypothetical protein